MDYNEIVQKMTKSRIIYKPNKHLNAIIGDYMLESAAITNMVIKSLGIDTIIVSSPEAIFNLVKANTKIDFIITNNLYNNSKYEGFKIVYELKHNLAFQKPIIVLTSSYNQKHYFIYECGFDDYLTKPLKINDVKELLPKVIPDLDFIKIS